MYCEVRTPEPLLGEKRNLSHRIPLVKYDILYPYCDETRDIWSNITLCLKEIPRVKPEGTPEGKGLYLTVYSESSPNTDIISF